MLHTRLQKTGTFFRSMVTMAAASIRMLLSYCVLPAFSDRFLGKKPGVAVYLSLNDTACQNRLPPPNAKTIITCHSKSKLNLFSEKVALDEPGRSRDGTRNGVILKHIARGIDGGNPIIDVVSGDGTGTGDLDPILSSENSPGIGKSR